MKKISIAKITFVTVLCVLGVIILTYLNSFEFMGDKFLDYIYGEHTIIYPGDVSGDMLQAAYDHNVRVSEWRIAEYGFDNNGWKFAFPTTYEVIPVCTVIANDPPA